jgi:Glycosyl hydrolase family 76
VRCRRPQRLSRDARRALAAYRAMQRYFYRGGGEYHEQLGGERSFLWPFSQALAATVSVAHIRGQQRHVAKALGAQLQGLASYLTTAVPVAIASTEALQSLPHYTATAASAGTGGTSFYDDNDWVGIELARVRELTDSEAPLALAEQIMSFEMDGWARDQRQPCPGGIPHSDAPDDESRSTISTAPAAELAVQLYRITADPSYLQFAEAAYEWVRACLLAPGGLYADHLEEDGETDPEIWSYTQGTMIGAGALLYEVTGNASYLEQAQQTARISLEAFPLSQLAAENPFFVSVFLRNLLYLDAIVRDGSGRKLAQEYVNWAWGSLLERRGLVLSASGRPTVLLGQSAIVQICALLSTPPSSYF